MATLWFSLAFDVASFIGIMIWIIKFQGMYFYFDIVELFEFPESFKFYLISSHRIQIYN